MKGRVVLCTQIYSRKYIPVDYFSVNSWDKKTHLQIANFHLNAAWETFPFFKLHCPLGEMIFRYIAMLREQKPSSVTSFSFESWTFCFLRISCRCLVWFWHHSTKMREAPLQPPFICSFIPLHVFSFFVCVLGNLVWEGLEVLLYFSEICGCKVVYPWWKVCAAIP